MIIKELVNLEEQEARLWKVLSLLQQVLSRVGIQRTKAGSKLGLTNSRMGILGAIYGNNDCTMSELAKDRFIALPVATRMVDELVKQKLLERVADGNDRRLVRIRITQKGKEAVDKVHQEAFLLLAQVLDKMKEDEQKALLKGLERFINAFMETEKEGLFYSPQNT